MAPTRGTCKMFRLSNETEPVIDSWQGVADVPRKPWVGVTYFFGKGSKQLDKIAMLKPQTKVHVTLRDGTVVHADPAELRLASHKKVHHFDLHTAQHPDLRHARHFDLPRSRRKGRFEIPFGEFGSEQNKNSNSPGDRPHASRLGVILEQPATVAMPRLGSDGVGAEGPDPPGAGHGGAHRDDAARQAPGPLHHGGIGGNGPRGARARADASDDASSDDDSAGSDQKDRGAIPHQDRTMSASPRLGEAHGQQPRPVHGVRGVRKDVESGTLQGALLGGDDSGVCGGARLPERKIVKKGIAPETEGRFPSLRDCYSSQPPPSSRLAPRPLRRLLGHGHPRASARSRSRRIWPRSTRKSEGPMAEDGKEPGSEGSEEIDLRKLKPAECERIQKLAAQRLEDRRQQHAREARQYEEKAHDRYTKPAGPPKLKMALEAPVETRKAPHEKNAKETEADTVSISSGSFSEVAPVTDND